MPAPDDPRVVPFETTVDLRYRDIDAMGHVNNAVYASLLEQARADYFDVVFGSDLSREGSVLASLSIEYERPIELRDGPVTITIDVPRVGTSSVPMTYELHRSDGERAATAETVQVAYDREAGSSVPLPDAWRVAIVDYHGLGGDTDVL